MGTCAAAFSTFLSRGWASFTGSISGGAITGGLVSDALSAGVLGAPPSVPVFAPEPEGGVFIAGVCIWQGVLPVVAIAPPESVTWTVYEYAPSAFGVPAIVPV